MHKCSVAYLELRNLLQRVLLSILTGAGESST